jgi:hypothetical protein
VLVVLLVVVLVLVLVLVLQLRPPPALANSYLSLPFASPSSNVERDDP